MTVLPIVTVRWLDSESRDGYWIAKDEFTTFAEAELEPCVSVGMLWHSDGEHIVLVQSVSADCLDGHIKIPKAAIVSMTVMPPIEVPHGDG